MIKVHSDKARRNPQSPLHSGFFLIKVRDVLIVHTTTIVTLVVRDWLERELVQCVHKVDGSDDLSHSERSGLNWFISRHLLLNVPVTIRFN